MWLFLLDAGGLTSITAGLKCHSIVAAAVSLLAKQKTVDMS